MTSRALVSCLCPTYNRAPEYPHLLAEVVESFRRQELPEGVAAELVILNDTAGQTLVCDVPGVRVVNVGQRFASLGEKRNELVRLASGDILLPWDDDDISLPGRIAQAVERLREGAGYFNPRRSWFLDATGLHSDHRHGYCHNASAFTRAAWEQASGYPHVSGAEDAVMDARLRGSVRLAAPLSDDPSAWTYLYRWNVSPCHLSGRAGGPPDDPHAPHYAAVGKQSITSGTFRIVPAWREDYAARCRAAASS